MQQKSTPLMQQYFALKDECSDAILLFQVGDFYELFFEDAKTVSAFLGITLTKRGTNNGEPIPLCGFPLVSANHHIAKLVKGGFKVALCDQLEEATPGKMVQRGITNVLTPGTLSADSLLDEKSPSFLCTFYPHPQGWGLLFSELVSSHMYATHVPFGQERQLEAELYRFLPEEVVLPDQKGMSSFIQFFKQRGFFTSVVAQHAQYDQDWQDWLTALDEQARKTLVEHQELYQVTKTWFIYIYKHQSRAVKACTTIQFYEPEDFLQLDTTTLKNLDIVKNSVSGSRKNTLLQFMDRAITPMGSRMMKAWLVRPLRQKDHIVARQEVLSLFIAHPGLFLQLGQALAACGDIERVIGRIAVGKPTLHDYKALKTMLGSVPQIAKLLHTHRSIHLIDAYLQKFSDFSVLESFLKKSLNDDVSKSYIIKPGFDQEVDRARDLVENGNIKILHLELQEQQKTGISSLKIRYNSVQGYYIEITKTHLDKVPQHFIRLQTLANAERFITQELQALQFEMVQAQESIANLEKKVFALIKDQVEQYIYPIRVCAQAIARIDALFGFAKVAAEYGYTCPEITHEKDIYIKQGKHPLLDAQLGNSCIPNDIELTSSQSIIVLTGPNMGGKSTYLRQVALLSILAQCGSFVPAKSARLPLLDRIFTRIGAGDNIAEGKSTFLLEMEEIAQICMQATDKSLVIVDEIGRGTSTFDGIAIAQAVLEYLHVQIACKPIFATHFHELTQACNQYPAIANYYAASKQTSSGIVFLHTIVPGVAQGSFGIEVAKLAQVPPVIIKRAHAILQQHTMISPLHAEQSVFSLQPAQEIKEEFSDVKAYKKLYEKVAQLDLDTINPKQALDILWSLRTDIKMND